MNNKTIFVLLITLLSSINLVNAQSQYLFGLSGGVSKPVGEFSEIWNTGFNIAGEVFYKGSDNMYTGWRVVYNRWSPDQSVLEEKYIDYYGLVTNISSSATLIEITPSIRFILSANKNRKTQFFGQISFGYYIIDIDVKASTIYNIDLIPISGSSGTEKNFGINLGAGIITKGPGNTKFTLYPMYNIMSNLAKETKYFSINAGFLFDK